MKRPYGGTRTFDDRNLPAVNACIREIGAALGLPVVADQRFVRETPDEELPLQIVETRGGGVFGVRVLHMQVAHTHIEVPTVSVELCVVESMVDEGRGTSGLPFLAEQPQEFTDALTAIAGLLQCGRHAKKAAKIAKRRGLLFGDGCYLLPPAQASEAPDGR